MKLKGLPDLKKWLLSGPEKWIILIGVGVLLIIIAIPTDKKSEEKKPLTNSQTEAADKITYEADMEKKLQEILSKVEGAGNVNVMITWDESEEIVLQTESSHEASLTEETDSDGGTRSIKSNKYSNSTLLSGGSTSGEPYVIKQNYPKVLGVVVLAQGAGSANIQSQISEAVQALFDIPAHKIKVLKAS